jgi:hypothetical protein
MQVAGLGSTTVLIVVSLERVGRVRTREQGQIALSRLNARTWPVNIGAVMARWQLGRVGSVVVHAINRAWGCLAKKRRLNSDFRAWCFDLEGREGSESAGALPARVSADSTDSYFRSRLLRSTLACRSAALVIRWSGLSLRFGFVPNRNGCNGQVTQMQFLTADLEPPEQSRQ